MKVGPLDAAIMVLYLVVVAVIGFWAGRRENKTSRDCFLAVSRREKRVAREDGHGLLRLSRTGAGVGRTAPPGREKKENLRWFFSMLLTRLRKSLHLVLGFYLAA